MTSMLNSVDVLSIIVTHSGVQLKMDKFVLGRDTGIHTILIIPL